MTPAAAPIIVVADLGAQDFAWLDRLRRTHFPPDRNVVPAHLTLFHHLPPSLLPELDSRLRAETRQIRRPAALIGDPQFLGGGVALRVRSEELIAIRARLSEAFDGLLTPQDAAGWRPHVTVQNKVESGVARRLHGDLLGRFEQLKPLDIAGLATFYYRGGPWEPIARYRFAG
jgi:hypothetical protein